VQATSFTIIFFVDYIKNTLTRIPFLMLDFLSRVSPCTFKKVPYRIIALFCDLFFPPPFFCCTPVYRAMPLQTFFGLPYDLICFISLGFVVCSIPLTKSDSARS